MHRILFRSIRTKIAPIGSILVMTGFLAVGVPPWARSRFLSQPRTPSYLLTTPI